MSSLNIAVLGDSAPERAKAAALLAKKSNPEDITFYHTVFSGRKINVIEPSDYPDKPLTLAYVCNLASYAIVLADAPSPTLGEILLALQLSGLKNGCVVSQADVSSFLKALNLDYPVFTSLQEAKEAAFRFEPTPKEGQTKTCIDHSFEVRGLGAVALGWMARGKLSVHQKIMAHPFSKQIEIKSIQENDVDVEHAECFDRLGIRFKGAEVADLSRGSVLSDSAKPVHQIEATVLCPKFLKNTPSQTLHAVAGLQSVPCVVDKPLKPGEENECVLEFHKPLFLDHDDIWLFDLNAKGLRLAGYAKEVV